MKIGLFAHRRYFEAFGMPQNFADRSGHCLIGFDRGRHVLQTTGGLAARLTHEAFNFRCDIVSAQLAALRAGVGIAACQTNVASRDPDPVAILPHEVMFEREVCVAMHDNSRSTRRTRLLFGHLVSSLTAYVAGDPPPNE